MRKESSANEKIIADFKAKIARRKRKTKPVMKRHWQH